MYMIIGLCKSQSQSISTCRTNGRLSVSIADCHDASAFTQHSLTSHSLLTPHVTVVVVPHGHHHQHHTVQTTHTTHTNMSMLCVGAGALTFPQTRACARARERGVLHACIETITFNELLLWRRWLAGWLE